MGQGHEAHLVTGFEAKHGAVWSCAALVGNVQFQREEVLEAVLVERGVHS